MPAIHTLNARGNVLLPVMRKHFAFSDRRTFFEVQRFHSDFLDILRSKGIDYASLRSALTAQPTKHEAAFLFVGDSSITLTPDGIEIKGNAIDILGKNTFVQGDRVDINK